MKNLLMPIWVLAFLCLFGSTQAQETTNTTTQTIRGTIVDKDSKFELIGASIAVMTTDPMIGTVTDMDGQFRLENVPVGRHDIQVQYLGYEPFVMNSVFLKSGKEMVLNIEMVESISDLETVTISASSQVDKTRPLNEMAAVSARSFSVEETSRYASAMFDPSRMALNYAGVSTGTGDDLFNEIVIRGNSPSGVLWRLEGIQIPNPNHFGALGNSGGAISMLSSSTLSNSDFYTGAFPSEYGSALSGVFDLNMRNGNNEQREHSFMFGLLGIEASTEGPFSAKSKASYLINYRYSTLAALDGLGLNPVGDILPAYQDVSFKINLPTERAGVFGIFGLGGSNISSYTPVADSTQWENSWDKFGYSETQVMGTIGVSHRKLFSNNSYLRTVAMASYESTAEDAYVLDVADNYKEFRDYSDKPVSINYRLSSTYNRKLNAKSTLQIGGVANHQTFQIFVDNYNFEEKKLVRLFENEGTNMLLEGFAHLKHRFNDQLTLNTGFHYSLMTLNNEMSFEPRAALSWKINDKQNLSLAAGLHSKQEQLGLYVFEGKDQEGNEIKAKDHLGLTKAFHGVLGYDYVFSSKLRLKTEVYYQHLYDIPVSGDPNSTFSILNAVDIWDYIGLETATNEGTGRNMGIDLTLEKFFTDDYYYMVTGSLYDSKFTAANGEEYSTRFNGNYQLNVLGGKEWKLKKKKNVLGVNAKMVLSGGARSTPIDFAASEVVGYEIRDYTQTFGQRSEPYFRTDIGISYKMNRKRTTHTFMLDIQNVTNKQNVAFEYYIPEDNRIEEYTQTGLFPNFNYRIEF